jgi:NADH-quinone oxidoreductase subunit J
MVQKTFLNFLWFLLTISSVLVISLRNSVQAVISLVMCFIISSVILLIMNCELFAFIFLIVYVGAIAVLFLFVLMMLELKDLENKHYVQHVLSCIMLPAIFFVITLPFIQENRTEETPYLFKAAVLPETMYNNFNPFYLEDNLIEIEVIGQVLYTRYALQFLILGLILTLAVICVGILTIDHKKPTYAKKHDLIVSRVFLTPPEKSSVKIEEI